MLSLKQLKINCKVHLQESGTQKSSYTNMYRLQIRTHTYQFMFVAYDKFDSIKIVCWGGKSFRTHSHVQTFRFSKISSFDINLKIDEW